jgi:hypothetical protein
MFSYKLKQFYIIYHIKLGLKLHKKGKCSGRDLYAIPGGDLKARGRGDCKDPVALAPWRRLTKGPGRASCRVQVAPRGVLAAGLAPLLDPPAPWQRLVKSRLSLIAKSWRCIGYRMGLIVESWRRLIVIACRWVCRPVHGAEDQVQWALPGGRTKRDGDRFSSIGGSSV